MANALIAGGRAGDDWANLVDTAGITASAETATLPAANLALSEIAKAWRLPAASGYVDLDFGADVGFDAVAFAQPNDGRLLAADDTWRIQVDADGGTAGTGAVYDTGSIATGVTARHGYGLHKPAARQTGRYIRVTWTAASLTSIDIGRLWVSKVIQPNVNLAYPFGVRWVSGTKPIQVADRSLIQYADEGARAREITGQWGHLTEAERNDVLDLQHDVGNFGQVLFCADPDDPGRETLFGRFIEPRPVVHPTYGLYQADFTLIESR